MLLIVQNYFKKLTMAKIKEIEIPNHDKYITTPEFNKLTKENFDERLKKANLVSKNDIYDFIKTTDFVEKLRKINNIVNSKKKIM